MPRGFILPPLTLLPMVTFAEEMTATAGAEASGTVRAPETPKVAGYSFGASNPTSMGSGAGHGAGKMSASGTMQVPKAIEERMQERDAMHLKLVGSTTEDRGEKKQNIKNFTILQMRR